MNDVVDVNQQATEEAVKQVNAFASYFQNHIPDLITFGINVILAIILFFVGRKLIKWVRKLVRTALQTSQVEHGVVTFADSILKFSLYGLLLYLIAVNFGFDTTSVAALLASAGVAIGLAVQGALSNFAGGVLILILKPFSVGDYIIEDNHSNEGTVVEIQLFYTKLLTLDNRSVIIPNGMLTNNSLTNVTKMNERCLDLKINISYDSDLKLAKKVLMSLIEKDERILKTKPINVFVSELGDDGIVLGVRAWTKTSEYWAVRWDFLENTKLGFDEAGIEIPYHKMDISIQSKNSN